MFSRFADQIRRAIRKHQMLSAGDRVLAGVSGGADSVCLAIVLKELGVEFAIAHLNHGLRGSESDGDGQFTKELAAKLGVEFFAKKVSLLRPSPDAAHRPLASFEASPYRASASPGEAAGREARRTFFKELCNEHGFTKVALAHTRNDRVETFLMNLLRGSGSEGLVSMAPVSGNIVRPLLDVGRDDIEAYLKEQNQEWRTDSTNFDPVFARNRLRHIVLPELASKFNPNLIETLARTTEILESEDVWMQALTDQWLREHGTREVDDFVIPAAALESEPAAMIRRVLRTALRMAGSDLQDVSFDQIEAVRSLLNAGKSGKIVQIPGGMQVTREFDRLVVRQEPAAIGNYNYELKIPGSVHIPELGKVFRAEIIEAVMDAANEGGSDRVFVDAGSIGPYVRIRNWNPGDYYRPVGLPGGKLKKLFQRARIPRGHRSRWPVIVAESTIVWVASFPVSREFVPREHSQKKVVFEALQS
jgi:tRNA(Ile)-lysidine synthase